MDNPRVGREAQVTMFAPPEIGARVIQSTARPRRRPDGRLVLGLLIVLAAVAAVVTLVSLADRRVAVYVASEALLPGDRVDAADLVERRVALDGAEDRYLTPGSLDGIGVVVTHPVAAGDLVPRSALGSSDGVRATALVLDLATEPSAVVAPGALVDVWGVRGEGDSSDPAEPSAAPVPIVVASEATVVRVLASDSLVASGVARVEVLVPRARVARLVEAIARGDVLVVVPAALPVAG